ncbi:MAG: hypothetical protein IPJ06_14875 [Saprospiraceae bacterium]|nr:hypothetical protein [Saprospiraceae bacterium]
MYTKRLSSQLAEDVGMRLLKEPDNAKLHRFLQDREFAFFDKGGNFIGEGLKVVEEMIDRIGHTFEVGKTL